MIKINLSATFLLLLPFIFPTPIHAQVVINEVFPAPVEGPEWIELYNASDEPVILDNWFLEDQLSSPSIIAKISDQTLPPTEFLTIELTSAKLNNSADGVVLKNSLSEIVDQMSYTTSESDLSWSRTTADSFELTQPTQGIINMMPTPSPSPSVSPTPSPDSSPATTAAQPTSSPVPAPLLDPTLSPAPVNPNPPSPPLSLVSVQSVSLISPSATNSSPQIKRTALLTTKKLPTTALLSVILGGSCLLLSSGWRIHEEIFKYHPNN